MSKSKRIIMSINKYVNIFIFLTHSKFIVLFSKCLTVFANNKPENDTSILFCDKFSIIRHHFCFHPWPQYLISRIPKCPLVLKRLEYFSSQYFKSCRYSTIATVSSVKIETLKLSLNMTLSHMCNGMSSRKCERIFEENLLS